MRSLIVNRKGEFQPQPPDGTPVGALRELLAQPDTLVWLDISDPDDDDQALLLHELRFHPLAVEDAVRSHERPKVDAYGHYYFLVFYEATLTAQDSHIMLGALSIFIGSNYLVTVHEEPNRHVEETQALWQIPDGPVDNKVSALVHGLLDSMVDDYFPLMDQVAERIESLEDTIFDRFEQGTIHTIFGLKKDLLDMRRAVAPERDVLNVLLRRELPIFDEHDLIYMQDVYDHIVRVTDSIDTYRDLMSSAVDSYLSLQSNRLNEIVKVLTMASIMLMAASLIAGIYGMNFDFMPELRWRLGYPWALGLMATVAVSLLVFFRRRGWW